MAEYLPGRRWSAEARGDHGLSLVVTYECDATGEDTRFVRTLEYQFSGLALRVANHLLLKGRIDRESAASLIALRNAVEKHLDPAGVTA